MSALSIAEKRHQRTRLFASMSGTIVAMGAVGLVYTAQLADGWTYQVDQTKSTKVRYISPTYAWVQKHGKAGPQVATVPDVPDTTTYHDDCQGVPA